MKTVDDHIQTSVSVEKTELQNKGIKSNSQEKRSWKKDMI